MNSTYKKILIKKYEEFSLENKSDRKKILRGEIEQLLANQDILDAEDYFIWGLIYYMIDGNENNILTAQGKFSKAIELDPKNYMPRLYLGHCYQDLGLIEEALKNYLKVDGERLKQEYPIWRFVKLKEQIGYCYYNLGNFVLGERYFEEVVKYYMKLPIDETAAPHEMRRCLPKDHKLIIEMNQIMEHLE